MDEPDDVEDVWPHTETVLFLTDSDQCFGTSIRQLMNRISNCKHLGNGSFHQGNDLSADLHCFGRNKIEYFDEIVPNSLIYVDFDLMLDTDFESYLRGNSIPKSSEIVILLDNPSYPNPESHIQKIRPPAETATSKEDIVEEAERYFKTICPACKGNVARRTVFDWKTVVYGRIHN